MKIQLKRSNVLQSGAAKEPTASQLEYGELAINYSNSDPAIFLKDSNNNIIRISGVGNVADDGLTNVPAGTTPPTNPTPESGNLWYNSDEGRLYIYYVDANTSQWVDASPDSWDPTVMPVTTNPAAQSGTLDDRYVMENGDTMTGALLLDNAASASAPDLSFDGDSDTGVYSPGANQVAVATNGTGRLFIDSSGRVGIGVTNPLVPFVLSHDGNQNIEMGYSTGTSSHYVQAYNRSTSAYQQLDLAGSVLTFKTATESMRIDSSGRLLVGTSSARTNYFNTTAYGPGLSIESTTNSDRVISFIHNDGASGAPLFVLGNSGNNSTPGGTGTVAANASLGFISFQGGDGTELVEAARITGAVDGTPGANDMPGKLTFQTTADGGTGPTERMRIDSLGNVGIGGSCSSFANQKTLSLFAGSSTVARLDFYNSDGSTREAEIISYSSNSESLRLSGITNRAMTFHTSNTERMRLDSSGNLGINTTGPAAKLDVNGNQTSNVVAMAALDVDCSAGNYFTKTIYGNSTFTFSNVPSSRSFSFVLELTHSSGTVTWPSSVKFPLDTAPTLTTGKTHLFVFVTDDGGSRFRGAALVDYVN